MESSLNLDLLELSGYPFHTNINTKMSVTREDIQKLFDELEASRASRKRPLEEAASPSDREIDANQKHFMSDHDKNLFIEQHKDGYAILRGGVKEPLAVEPTQDAAVEKARKLDPDAAIHVERVRNVEGGGRDKWRRI
jgi:hypothetical protein